MLWCSRGRTAVVAGRLLGAGVQQHELASRARPEHGEQQYLCRVVGKGKRFVALALVVLDRPCHRPVLCLSCSTYSSPSIYHHHAVLVALPPVHTLPHTTPYPIASALSARPSSRRSAPAQPREPAPTAIRAQTKGRHARWHNCTQGTAQA